ncbi:MAG TPA: thioredoxin domain-containing protein [Desulfuromonadaceae bacterium]|jgi:hypothetical protein
MKTANSNINQHFKPLIPSPPFGELVACYGVCIALFAGVILSIVSVLKICSACSDMGDFSIFGLNFGWFGISYFSLLLGLKIATHRFFRVDWLVLFLLAAAAGAETRFIWLQKYDIGHWCPICLGIAGVVFSGVLFKSYESWGLLTRKGAGMKVCAKLFLSVIIMVAIGLGGAILGVKRESQAAELDPFLGKQKSATIVYFVSDWFCPSCRKVEPVVEKMFPDIARLAKVTFVDFPIHRETSNFTPYNLQFLYLEKDKYIPLRKALGDLALKTKNPSPDQVQAAVAPFGVKLHQLDMADILYGTQANLSVYRGFNLNSTPSVVVTNTRTKKTKILVGDKQITEQAVKSAIQEVEK